MSSPSPRNLAAQTPTLSVVLPVFNESLILDRLYDLVKQAIAVSGCRGEIVFVNDGSNDGSGEVLDKLARHDPIVKVIHFSRNFGHQSALQAGLSHARGDAIVVMDSDLQDDPRSIVEFVSRWRAGYDVVYAIRTHRKEHPIKVLMFQGFHWLLSRISNIPIPLDAGNYGLVDRRVAREIVGLLDRDRYYPGLRSWVGFHQVGIPVERGERYDDQPRVSLLGLWRLAKNAVFSFSTFPLTIFYVIGWLSIAVFLGLSGFTLYHKLFTGEAIPGWTSDTITTSFMGAINALGIAILGEYVIRIYNQVRARPLYVVERRVNLESDAEAAVGSDADGWDKRGSIVNGEITPSALSGQSGPR